MLQDYLQQLAIITKEKTPAPIPITKKKMITSMVMIKTAVSFEIKTITIMKTETVTIMATGLQAMLENSTMSAKQAWKRKVLMVP